MADAPIREHDWLWVPGSEHKLQPVDKLVNMYYNSVGRNANLILGAVPDTDGLIPEADFKRYAEFGGEIRRRFETPVARTQGSRTAIELKLRRPARFNHLVIMEEITRGERVREYVVEALVSDGRWQKLCDGASIGHKRIQKFASLKAGSIRLRIARSIAEPIIRSLAVYDVT